MNEAITGSCNLPRWHVQHVYPVSDECQYVKLLGGSIYEEDPEYGLGIFRRVDVNGNTEYESMDESGFRVWLDEELESWVVGRLIAFQKNNDAIMYIWCTCSIELFESNTVYSIING